MSHVTRITQAEGLTRRKLGGLVALTKALGKIRAYVWRKYGSIEGVCKSKYEIQNEVRPLFKHFNIASHVVGGTILDAAKDIQANREAAKAEVVRAIFRHTDDNNERKRLCTALKVDKSYDCFQSWTEDRYLRRQMRKHCKHGRSKCMNQIVLPVDCYEWFDLNGRGYISVMGFITTKHNRNPRCNKVRKVAMPLTTNQKIEGQIRVILKGDVIHIHYGIEAEAGKPCGDRIVGVDKGYTEVFVDSDGAKHGEGLGEVLSAESDALKVKWQGRRRLAAIAEKSNTVKRARIERNNLGRRKIDARKARHRKIVSTLVHRAAHTVVDKAKKIVTEDLSGRFEFKDRGANANRRISAWVKGEIKNALESVASRRSASVTLVNAAYTSQTCPTCGCFGKRSGDAFYCETCRDVKRSDHVAAQNVLARLNDKEITLYTPYRKVKEILLARSAPRLRLSNQDSSCATVASTESEVPISTTRNCG